LTKLHTWAHLRHDEDIINTDYKNAFERITAMAYAFQEETSWLNPEILALPETAISTYLSAPTLEKYTFHLEKVLLVKKHTLTPDKEELLAMAGKALRTPQQAFGAINNADFKFGSVADSTGKMQELTHGSYGLYIREHDRTLRKNSFQRLHDQFNKYENSLCELLSGQVQNHFFNARARRYSNCLEAALFPNKIDTSVYKALIQAVKDHIHHLHRYMTLRKRILNVDELHMYDLYVPLTTEVDIKMDYAEAQNVVIESVALLGSDYQNLVQQGLKQGRWVDCYENKNKRSGAYSSGCYDSMPYILLNYQSTLRDVFTLAHEVGHSMHSLLSNTHQPYHYANYPIFVAEVASTFNEEMLVHLLLQRCQSTEEKIYLINEKIEDIRATLFRQTMFAEFELLIHTLAEENVPLTAALLKEEYHKLNAAYFGKDVVLDEEINIEWARIPHFYYNFYVYQYATGISAALTLAHNVREGSTQERQQYLSFLQGGCSQYPLDLLRYAGVDLRSPKPVETAIHKFASLVDQLEELLSTKVN